jgi:phosphatidylinositol 3-kinase
VPKRERGELERLEKLMNKFERGQVAHIEWLDSLTFKAIERIKEEESKRNGSTHLHLIVDLRTFEHPVAFQELGANLLMQSPISPSNELVTVWDPEVGRQNPSENKQLKLARSVTRVVIDRDLKPNINERKYWHFFLFYLCLHSVRFMHK